MDPVSNNHESGQQYHIRDAMNDIATTIENMVDNQQYEGQ